MNHSSHTHGCANDNDPSRAHGAAKEPALMCVACMHEKHGGQCADCRCMDPEGSGEIAAVTYVLYRLAQIVLPIAIPTARWLHPVLLIALILVAYYGLMAVRRWSVRIELDEARDEQRRSGSRRRARPASVPVGSHG